MNRRPSGLDSQIAAQNARHVGEAVRRIKQQPYVTTSGRRQPRPGVSMNWCLFQLSSTLSAATGTWPSITPTTQSNVSCYQPSTISGSSSLQLIGTFTVQNWRNVSWSASKTSHGVLNGDGTVTILDQDC